MTNVILVVGILAIVALAARPAITHFRGQGGCCGGGDYKPHRKRLRGVRFQKIFTVEGMTCAHCAARVEECVNDLAGVAGRVDLKKGELTVSYAEAVEDKTIIERIERAGYHVRDIREGK